MRSDARFILNQRRFKKPLIQKRGVTDARKILNSRLGKNANLRTSGITRNANLRTTGITRNANLRSTGITRNAVTQRSFSNNQRGNPIKAPEKRVKLSSDGNILITARSKNSGASGSRTANVSTTQANIQSFPRWAPADVDSVDVEHVGIADVLDMDALPSAVIGTNNKFQGRLSHRSLAEEIVDMPNTMVADQISSPQHSTSVYVSNLHGSVSKQDVMELFGDIGLIKRVEMLQPGIATVEFFDTADAVRACDLYHNRLLDGQPMQCFIQQPSPQRSLISQRLGGRIQSIPSFSQSSSSVNSRVMHNPRNVRFTVKLT